MAVVYPPVKLYFPMSATAPERLEVIDALRGAALFGVLYSNMLWFAGLGNALDAAQAREQPCRAARRGHRRGKGEVDRGIGRHAAGARRLN